MTTIREMLERNSIPEPMSGCWIWLRGCSNNYPVAWWEGKQQYATRLALKVIGATPSDDDDACHYCDNTFCVNPEHLFVGTRQQNMFDASTKGRLKHEVCPKGHSYEGNVYRSPSGKRECLICKKHRDRMYYQNRKNDKHT